MKNGKVLSIAKRACPVCGGEVMLNYKHRAGLGKCVKCSRIWRVEVINRV